MTDGNEAMGFSTGCSDARAAALPVRRPAVASGVPIKAVPFAERLLQLGLTRRSFVTVGRGDLRLAGVADPRS